jgi:antitoxin (DNA-binding transcriptional repressor) of toxin-antitoxin stability system
MRIVTIHAAKASLSKLIARACAGEEVIIARGSQAVARLVPVGRVKPGRHFGALKGQVAVHRDFFKPLPSAETSASAK